MVAGDRGFFGARLSARAVIEVDLLWSHGARLRSFTLGVFQLIDSEPNRFTSTANKTARAMPESLFALDRPKELRNGLRHALIWNACSTSE